MINSLTFNHVNGIAFRASMRKIRFIHGIRLVIVSAVFFLIYTGHCRNFIGIKFETDVYALSGNPNVKHRTMFSFKLTRSNTIGNVIHLTFVRK